MRRLAAVVMVAMVPGLAFAGKGPCSVMKEKTDAFSGTSFKTYTTPSSGWVTWGSDTPFGSWEGKSHVGAVRAFTVGAMSGATTFSFEYWLNGKVDGAKVPAGTKVGVRLQDGTIVELATVGEAQGAAAAETVGVVTKISLAFSLTPEQTKQFGASPPAAIKLSIAGKDIAHAVFNKHVSKLGMAFTCAAGG